MQIATQQDRKRVTDILCDAFQDNRSVNYIIPQDDRRKQRIRALMDYSFDICQLYGKVYLSEDKNACALVYFPDQKTKGLKSLGPDIRLILNCTGLGYMLKALRREKVIKKCYPSQHIYYLWFIGVASADQGQGAGRKMLGEILLDAHTRNRPVYLETSSEKNISWYTRAGFEMYRQLDLGYDLFMFRKS